MGDTRALEPPDRLPARYGDYRIDWLRPWDLPQVARLEAAVFPEPFSLARLTRLWLKRNVRYIVARQQQQVAAYIGFEFLGPAAHTISMAVHPTHRRRGLATVIQLTADEVARRRGARWFFGEVRVSNVAQRRFLETLGWQRVGVAPRFFGNGEDALVVWHWL